MHNLKSQNICLRPPLGHVRKDRTDILVEKIFSWAPKLKKYHQIVRLSKLQLFAHTYTSWPNNISPLLKCKKTNKGRYLRERERIYTAKQEG